MTTSTTATPPTPPENMTVGELREWLKSFEKKNKEHFQKNQVVRGCRGSPTTTNRTSMTGRRLSVRDRVVGLQQRLVQQHHELPSSSQLYDADSESDAISQQENSAPPSSTSNIGSFMMVMKQPPEPINRFVAGGNAQENQCPSVINNKRSSDHDNYDTTIIKPDYHPLLIKNNQVDTDDTPFEKAFAVVKKECPETTTSMSQDNNDDDDDDDSLELEPVNSSGSGFGEFPDKQFFEEQLCLTLSGVTLASSSSFVEADASEPPVVAAAEEEASVETFNFGNYDDESPFLLQQPDDDLGSCKTNSSEPQQQQQQQQPKAVPETWSEYEPIDFDASGEGSSTTDSSCSEKEKEDTFGSDHWPKWTDDGDARQYLKKQALPPFQGYWSDNDCNDSDDDDDDDSFATGARTEPIIRSFRDKGGRKSRRGHFKGIGGAAEGQDRRGAVFSLADAAMDSMPGINNDNTRSRKKTLSEHLKEGSSGKTKPVKKPDTTPPDNQSMHSANLFQDNTLTSGALDAICNGRTDSPPAQNNGKVGSNLTSFFERGDQGTISSWSIDSGKPSVAPNAVDPKLSSVFSNDSDETMGTFSHEKGQPVQARNAAVNTRMKASSFPTTSKLETQKESPTDTTKRAVVESSSSIKLTKSDEKSSTFSLSPEECQPNRARNTTVNAWMKDSSSPTSKSETKKESPTGIMKKTSMETSCCVKPTKSAEKSHGHSFSSMIEKFGGGAARPVRKTRIQRQKEALEEQWANNKRVVVQGRKTKWQVGQRPGAYKRRVVLDYVEK